MTSEPTHPSSPILPHDTLPMGGNKGGSAGSDSEASKAAPRLVTGEPDRTEFVDKSTPPTLGDAKRSGQAPRPDAAVSTGTDEHRKDSRGDAAKVSPDSRPHLGGSNQPQVKPGQQAGQTTKPSGEADARGAADKSREGQHGSAK
ncbi:MAG: hypothetical protein IPK67_15375 [Planctomycetes bacterium]|nr:hypothetical protein [Planctomycetota bacterium]